MTAKKLIDGGMNEKAKIVLAYLVKHYPGRESGRRGEGIIGKAGKVSCPLTLLLL